MALRGLASAREGRRVGSDCSCGRCGQVEMRAPESAPELGERDGAALEVRGAVWIPGCKADALARHEGRQETRRTFTHAVTGVRHC